MFRLNLCAFQSKAILQESGGFFCTFLPHRTVNWNEWAALQATHGNMPEANTSSVAPYMGERSLGLAQTSGKWSHDGQPPAQSAVAMEFPAAHNKMLVSPLTQKGRTRTMSLTTYGHVAVLGQWWHQHLLRAAARRKISLGNNRLSCDSFQWVGSFLLITRFTTVIGTDRTYYTSAHFIQFILYS